MFRQRGFLAFLLGNPMFLLCAGLGIALIGAGIAGKIYKAQRDGARAEVVQVKAEYAGFRMEQDRIGKAAQQAAKAKEAEQRSDNEAVIKAYERQTADLRNALKRLRDSPPVRPDGSSVPVLACGPSSPDGAAGQSVPIAEYRSLEDRAAQDALTIVTWQNWARLQGLTSEKGN